MIADSMYRRELDVQVKEMLRLARRKSGSFGKDCLSDPGKLRWHWSGCLDIVYYSSRDEGRLKAVREDARTMDDNASYADLLGFFSPSLVNPGIEMDKAYVAWADGEYTTRRNFTLLHEIGHYLQETDFDLMVRVGSFEDDYVAKRFEEDACNRFASMALLPDKFISEWLPRGRSPRAADIYDIFEQGRTCAPEKNKVRVSRTAVVRRLGALLPSLGYASLIENPYEEDRPPKVACRAWSDGDVDFSSEFTAAEDMLYARARSGRKRPGDGECFASDTRMLLGLPCGERPLRGDVVFSRGRKEYAFMVVEYPPKAGKEDIRAGLRPFDGIDGSISACGSDVPDYVLDMERKTMSAFAEWNSTTPNRRSGKLLSERTANEQLRFLTDLGGTLRSVGCDELADGMSETIFSYDTYAAFRPVYQRICEKMPVADPKRTRKSHLISALTRYGSFLAGV